METWRGRWRFWKQQLTELGFKGLEQIRLGCCWWREIAEGLGDRAISGEAEHCCSS